MIDWHIEGIAFGNCNCNYGCPCQFEDKPTHGHCRGFEVFRIDKGHFAEVSLDGLAAAITYAWPGPIYEGKGEMQVIIDERADADSGPRSKPCSRAARPRRRRRTGGCSTPCPTGSTRHCSSRSSSRCDIEGRTARVVVPGILESTGRPIRSPVTGEPHRVRIDLPDGIEFTLAEVGSATTKATAAVALDLSDSYGQFNRLRHSGTGVSR